MKLGIIGGGQLAMMMLQEKEDFDLEVSVLDRIDCCSAALADHLVVGSPKTPEDIQRLAELCDIITFEVEDLHLPTLFELELAGKTIIPKPSALSLIQDKSIQKDFYQTSGIPTAKFIVAKTQQEICNALVKLNITDKFVCKLSRGGYDGKGVWVLRKNENWEDKLPDEGNWVIEEFIPDMKEISVIVARDQMANVNCYDVVEMKFDPELNLVDTLICPAQIPEEIASRAKTIATKVVENLKSPGIFAVEMFLTPQNEILVNETALRPHNSGHMTIEANESSQFNQLIQILTGQPLLPMETKHHSAMKNVIGNPELRDGWEKDLRGKGIYPHNYGKENRPGRKVGHITFTGDTHEEVMLKINTTYLFI